jgi:hypothetical protein
MSLMSKLKQQDALLTFLVLECLAICAFALGNISYIFYILGILVGGASIALCFERFKGENLKSLLLFTVPMFILSIFVSFGKLLSSHIFENILVFLSINIFLFMGIVMRRFKGFKIELVLIVLGFAIALLLLISMIYSWTQYGFFYAAIYKKTPIYYYNAELFDVTKEGYWLVGFSFKEMSINYTSTFAIILACYLLGLLFISPKENKRVFYIFLALGLVGLIYIITIPNFKALLFLVPAIAIALCYRFVKDQKKFTTILDYALLAFMAIAIVFFVLALLNAAGTGIASKIEGNRILNRIFNSNRIMVDINPVLKQAAYKYNLFGFLTVHNPDIMTYVQFEELQEASVTNTGMFEIELIKEGGLFTIPLIVAVVVITYIFSKKYLLESKDNAFGKVTLVTLLATVFFYLTFENEIFPLIHQNENYYSFFRNPLVLVIIALIGMMYPYTPKDEDDKEVHQKEERPAAYQKEEDAMEDMSI